MLELNSIKTHIAKFKTEKEIKFRPTPIIQKPVINPGTGKSKIFSITKNKRDQSQSHNLPFPLEDNSTNKFEIKNFTVFLNESYNTQYHKFYLPGRVINKNRLILNDIIERMGTYSGIRLENSIISYKINEVLEENQKEEGGDTEERMEIDEEDKAMMDNIDIKQDEVVLNKTENEISTNINLNNNPDSYQNEASNSNYSLMDHKIKTQENININNNDIKNKENSNINPLPVINENSNIKDELSSVGVYLYVGSYPLQENYLISLPPNDTIYIKTRPLLFKEHQLHLDLFEEEVEHRDYHNKQHFFINKNSKRAKERKISKAIKHVYLWKKIYHFLTDTNGNKVRITLEEAAGKVGISKKSLDEYMNQIYKGRKMGFDFNKHRNDKVSVLRGFVKKYDRNNEEGDNKEEEGNVEI